MKKIGVLGLQGDFEKHVRTLGMAGADPRLVVAAEDVPGLDGLVIPGGESTTIGKLMVAFGLLEPIKARIAAGMPVLGTCAGMILLAARITGSSQPRIGMLDAEVNRNAYGRQIESFEADIPVSFISEPVRGVFIRAPKIVALGPSVEVLGTFEDVPVLVRQGAMLACAFHPELTDETRIHEYFLSL
jgi:pyridoxal 5'-phosphate synthase pdxT subunit